MPERALLLARSHDTVCLSPAVGGEIRQVLQRPKFRRYIPEISRQRILDILGAAALMFHPIDRVSDCRDLKDNKCLELELAAGASTVSYTHLTLPTKRSKRNSPPIMPNVRL